VSIRWEWGEPPDPRFWQLLATISKRESWAIEHGLIVAKISALTAQALTLPDDKIEKISVAGLLHDVGKLTLPTELLQKPQPLTEEEYAQIKRHPSKGVQIITALHLPSETIEAVHHHHERVDGEGYPFGKRGSEIPVEGRIVAVGEMLGATLTPRWYRPPLSPIQALERLESAAGTALDRELVKCAKSQLPKLFGFSSLTSLSLCTKPVPIERLVQEEDASLWQTISTFLVILLTEMERIIGRQFCQLLVNCLNRWLEENKIPLHFQGLKPVSKYRWWQTLGELALFGRIILGTVHAMLSRLTGSEFVSDWLDGVREQLNEQFDAVGFRYGLWIWQRNSPFAGVKVNEYRGIH